jgi:uncharacterized membrane protein
LSDNQRVSQTLRPLTIGELLDRTFFYYRNHFVLFVGLAALPALLGLIFQLAGLFKPAGTSILLSGLFTLATLAVFLVTSTLTHGATIVAVSQILLDRPTNVVEAFQSIRPRVGELILISLNVGVRVLIGFILCIVPGILWSLRYSLAVPAAVLEETGISDSISRSSTLTEGHRGRIFLIYLLIGVLTLLANLLWPFLTMFVATLMSPGVRSGHPPIWVQASLQFGSFLSQSLLGPITSIALTLVYYDVRVRGEAFDLEHMMQLLDGAVRPTPSA